MDSATALKSRKAFEKLLKAGYIETNQYQVSYSKTITELNKNGKYVLFVEHAQGYQVFTETDNHLA